MLHIQTLRRYPEQASAGVGSGRLKFSKWFSRRAHFRFRLCGIDGCVSGADGFAERPHQVMVLDAPARLHAA